MTFWPTNDAGKPTMQGFGAALQGAAPLLLNMGAGMMAGNASAGVQNGLAAMMAMEQRKKEDERYEEEQRIAAQRYGDQQSRLDANFGLRQAEFDWRRNHANREWDWQRSEAERQAEAQQAQMSGMSDFFGSMMGPGPGQQGYQGATPFEPVGRNDAMASMGGPTNEAAAMMNDPSLAVIQRFEGFRESPYWDVNAHRAGYGSDTVTTADGRVVQVTPETRVSRTDANRDLMRRVQTEFQPAVARAVGRDAWASMDDRQKAALTSLTYNYGAGAWDDDLAPVAAAVRTGDPREVAVAIDRLGSHNGGVNARRRRMEAMLFANGGGGQPQQPQRPQVDPTRLAQIMMSSAVPAQVKEYAFSQAFPDQPDPTTAQRNFEFLVGQGMDAEAALDRAFSGGANVTVNTGEGEQDQYLYGSDAGLPAGFRLDRKTGQASPIPGGPAAEEQAAAEQARENAADQREQYGSVVFEDINRVRDMLTGGRAEPITGITGGLAARAPGTEASDARALVETIKANIGFDRLQQMREASPTGGALGNVTERELATLQAVMGNLEFSQSKDQLMQNLDRLQDVYAGILNKAAETGDGSFVPRGEGGATVGPPRPAGGIGPDTFEAFAADPAVKQAADRYGVTVQEMWQMRNGGS